MSPICKFRCVHVLCISCISCICASHRYSPTHINPPTPNSAHPPSQGPSGCGKTSLLRYLRGLWHLKKDSGHVTNISGIGAGGILYLPQRPYVFPGTLQVPACIFHHPPPLSFPPPLSLAWTWLSFSSIHTVPRTGPSPPHLCFSFRFKRAHSLTHSLARSLTHTLIHSRANTSTSVPLFCLFNPKP